MSSRVQTVVYQLDAVFFECDDIMLTNMHTHAEETDSMGCVAVSRCLSPRKPAAIPACAGWETHLCNNFGHTPCCEVCDGLGQMSNCHYTQIKTS